VVVVVPVVSVGVVAVVSELPPPPQPARAIPSENRYSHLENLFFNMTYLLLKIYLLLSGENLIPFDKSLKQDLASIYRKTSIYVMSV
jgi:hypothetical protein